MESELREKVRKMDREELEEQLIQLRLKGSRVSPLRHQSYLTFSGKSENWLGYDINYLKFDRFVNEKGELPDTLSQPFSWCQLEAEVCRQRGTGYFCDPEQAELELKDPKVYQQISTTIKTADALRAQQKQVIQLEKTLDERRHLLAKVIGSVHVWRRPHQIISNPYYFGPSNNLLARPPQDPAATVDRPGLVRTTPIRAANHIPHLIKFKNLGVFADAYFHTAVAMAATNRTLFTNIFVSFEYSDIGMYTFQFFSTLRDELNEPGWRAVTIDSLLPAGQAEEGSPATLCSVFGGLDNADEIWLMLLEKAYAKFMDSYSLLHHGDTAEAAINLTGGQCILDTWGPQMQESELARLWWKLHECRSNGLLLAAVQTQHNTEVTGLRTCVRTGMDDYLDWNESAVVILDSTDVPVKHPTYSDRAQKLVKFRNIYGVSDWTGTWSNSSKTWTKDLRTLLGYENKYQDDFLSWMNIDDFIKRFNTLLTVHLFPGAPQVYFRHLEKREEGTTAFHAHQYLLVVSDPKRSQRKARMTDADRFAFSVSMESGVDQSKFELSDEDFSDDSDDPEDDTQRREGIDAMMRSVEQVERAYDESARRSMVDFDEDRQTVDGKKIEAFSFKRLKQNVASGTARATKNIEQEEEKGPRYVLRVYFSQPMRSLRDFHSERTTGARQTNVYLFQVKGRTLQPCCYVDSEYGAEKQRLGEGDKMWYTFPANNRVKFKQEKSESSYSSVQTANLHPGYYVLAVYQEDHMEELDYCLRLDTFQDPELPANYSMSIEEIGSCAKPLIEIDTSVAQ
eukprot:TRINITY_DN3910_c0_g1_i1.p1 TRINITY_DN3910_c0_g1~~TRINITY_DN3910_c0_g1_i1.p1  ORF type:complete len:794 (+),score=130.26 TRINITY_DN3910_c0_g1_i1:34-2415(+)